MSIKFETFGTRIDPGYMRTTVVALPMGEEPKREPGPIRKTMAPRQAADKMTTGEHASSSSSTLSSVVAEVSHADPSVI